MSRRSFPLARRLHYRQGVWRDTEILLLNICVEIQGLCNRDRAARNYALRYTRHLEFPCCRDRS